MSIPQSQPQKPASLRRKKGPPKAIFIPGIDAAEDEPQACLAPSRNHGGLSLNLPSAGSSTHSLLLPQQNLVQPARQQPLNSAVSELSRTNRLRRPSAVSLPSTANPLMRTRAVEDGDPAIPYQDGPIEFLPGMWLGSEDNAKDWKGLAVRGIRSILNVAKELSSPFDDVVPLRAAISTPNLGEANNNGGGGKVSSTYLPPSTSSGRPGMNYLKLQWSHGQQDLVEGGFPAAMTFVDAAVCERSEGVLIHCQCGMSRSATVAIALVMRAAAERSPRVPPEVWDLKGMQGAYDYVKSKSRWAGPNMSLIYQLLEYEKKLQKFDVDGTSPLSASSRSSLLSDEEEWARRRQMLDDESDNSDDAASPVAASVMEEALALDKAMEDRLVAKQSGTPLVPTFGGVGMGAAWRSKYARKRSGSARSTSASILSEDLVEEDEEVVLLGLERSVGDYPRGRSPSLDRDSATTSDSPNSTLSRAESVYIGRPVVSAGFQLKPAPVGRRRPNLSNAAAPMRTGPPPSAPAFRTSFNISPLPDITSSTTSMKKGCRRRPSLSVLPGLPPVPSSPEVKIAASTPDVKIVPSSPEVKIVVESSTPSPRRTVSSPQRAVSSPQLSSPSPLKYSSHISRGTKVPGLPVIQVDSSTPSTPRSRTISFASSRASHVASPAAESLRTPRSRTTSTVSDKIPLRLRKRTDESRPVPPPLHLAAAFNNAKASRTKTHTPSHSQSDVMSHLQTPSHTQTLFVFPPSPTLQKYDSNATPRIMMPPTPRTMTLTSGIPFPTLTSATPRVSTFRTHGRTKSFIGLGSSPLPTTGFSRVDATGYVGIE